MSTTVDSHVCVAEATAAQASAIWSARYWANSRLSRRRASLIVVGLV